MNNNLILYGLDVAQIYPHPYMTDVNVTTQVRVTFNSDVNENSLYGNVFLLLDKDRRYAGDKVIELSKYTNIDCYFAYNNRTITLSPKQHLDLGQRYIIYIPKQTIKDVLGKRMELDYISYFTTPLLRDNPYDPEQILYHPPVVVYPGNGTIVDRLDTVSWKQSEALEFSTFTDKAFGNIPSTITEETIMQYKLLDNNLPVNSAVLESSILVKINNTIIDSDRIIYDANTKNISVTVDVGDAGKQLTISYRALYNGSIENAKHNPNAYVIQISKSSTFESLVVNKIAVESKFFDDTSFIDREFGVVPNNANDGDKVTLQLLDGNNNKTYGVLFSSIVVKVGNIIQHQDRVSVNTADGIVELTVYEADRYKPIRISYNMAFANIPASWDSLDNNTISLGVSEFRLTQGLYYLRIRALSGEFGESIRFFIKEIESHPVSEEDRIHLDIAEEPQEDFTILETFPADNDSNMSTKISTMYIRVTPMIHPNLYGSIVCSITADYSDQNDEDRLDSNDNLAVTVHTPINGRWTIINDVEVNESYIVFVPSILETEEVS